jgi:hypothetical protein
MAKAGRKRKYKGVELVLLGTRVHPDTRELLIALGRALGSAQGDVVEAALLRLLDAVLADEGRRGDVPPDVLVQLQELERRIRGR